MKEKQSPLCLGEAKTEGRMRQIKKSKHMWYFKGHYLYYYFFLKREAILV